MTCQTGKSRTQYLLICNYSSQLGLKDFNTKKIQKCKYYNAKLW